MRLLHVGANLFRYGDAEREPRRHAQLCHRESGGSPTSPDLKLVKLQGGSAMKLPTAIASWAFLAAAFLLSIPASSYAGGIGARLSIDVTVTPSGAGYDWDYRVTLLNPPADGAAIGAIEIPEVQLGYLDWTIFTLPTGWLGTEITSPAFGDPLIKPNG